MEVSKTSHQDQKTTQAKQVADECVSDLIKVTRAPLGKKQVITPSFDNDEYTVTTKPTCVGPSCNKTVG